VSLGVFRNLPKFGSAYTSERLARWTTYENIDSVLRRSTISNRLQILTWVQINDVERGRSASVARAVALVEVHGMRGHGLWIDFYRTSNGEACLMKTEGETTTP
jgi:hypothetical protein